MHWLDFSYSKHECHLLYCLSAKEHFRRTYFQGNIPFSYRMPKLIASKKVALPNTYKRSRRFHTRRITAKYRSEYNALWISQKNITRFHCNSLRVTQFVFHVETSHPRIFHEKKSHEITNDMEYHESDGIEFLTKISKTIRLHRFQSYRFAIIKRVFLVIVSYVHSTEKRATNGGTTE